MKRLLLSLLFLAAPLLAQSGQHPFTGPGQKHSGGGGAPVGCGTQGSGASQVATDQSQCAAQGNAFPPPLASPTLVSACQSLVGNKNYQLSSNIGSSLTSACLIIQGPNTKVDLNGFSVSGFANFTTDTNGDRLFSSKPGSTITCQTDSSAQACVYGNIGSQPNFNTLFELDHFNVQNTTTNSTSSARNVFFDYGSLNSSTMGSNPTIAIHNIGSISATGTSSTRIVNLQVQATGTGGVPSNKAYPAFYNNQTECQSTAAACQGIVIYGVANYQAYNNYLINDLANASNTETARAIIADQTAPGSMFNNYINCQDGRCFRLRGTTGANVHDNIFDHLVRGSNGNYVAGVHIGDPDCPTPCEETENATIQNNIVNVDNTSAQIAFARNVKGVTEQSDTVHTTGSTAFWRAITQSGGTNALNIYNTSVTGGGSLASSCDASSSGKWCFSGTVSGGTCGVSNTTPCSSTGGGFPAPPAGALNFTNVQLLPNSQGSHGGWNYCNALTPPSGCNAGGSGTTGVFSLTHDVTSPSGMTHSMKMSNQGANFNTLWYLPLDCPTQGCAAVTDMSVDKLVEPEVLTNSVALEDDPDLYVGGFEYFPSFQCDFGGTGHWRIYNIENQGIGTNGGWTDTVYPCPLSSVSTGVRHHMQHHETYNTTTHTYCYKEFFWDDVQVWASGPCFNAKAASGNKLNVENQMDNKGGTQTNIVWYGNFNYSVWGVGFGGGGGSAFYVSPSGSDSNTGTQASPWKTIGHAITSTGAGATIHAAAGTYPESPWETTSGSSGNPITFVSDTPLGAKITGTAGWGFRLDGSYINVQDFDISGPSNPYAVRIIGSNVNVTGNYIHNVGTDPSCLSGGAISVSSVSNVLIDSNIITNISPARSVSTRCNHMHGMYLQGTNVTVTNNIIDQVWQGFGIQVAGPSLTGYVISNNTLFNNGDSRSAFSQSPTGGTFYYECYASTTCSGLRFQNNIAYDNTALGFYNIFEAIDSGATISGSVYTNNNFNTAGSNVFVSGSLSNTVTGNPSFVNYKNDGTGNYALTSSSPDITAGTSTSAPAFDITGTSRPSPPSIGAYQYVAPLGASNHVVTIMLENRSVAQATQYMPYTAALAANYATFSNMYSPAHGSFNAYLEMTSGTVSNGSGTGYATSTLPFTTSHCNGDGCVDTNGNAAIVTVANLARQLAANGKTWKAYMQSQPSGSVPLGYWCYTGSSSGCGGSSDYVRRHNPMAFYSDVTNEPSLGTFTATSNSAKIVGTTNMLSDFTNGNIANWTWISPDLTHDAHNQGPTVPSCNGNVDCTALMNADAYMQAIVPTILASTPFQPGGDGVLIITFDEGELSGDDSCSSTVSTGCGGHIFTAIIGPNVKKNHTISTNYQLRNLLSSACTLLNLTACPGDGSTAATVLNDVF